MPDPQNPARRRDHSARIERSERQLLRAAFELIREKGYQNASAAEIGRRAGFSRAMVHARFGSKDALLDQLMRSEYEERVRQPPAIGLSGLERLLAHIAHLEELFDEDAEFLRGVFALNFEAVHDDPSLTPRIARWINELRESLMEAYRDGITDGSCRPGQDPEQLALQIIAIGVGLAYCWIVIPEHIDYPDALRRWREQTRDACVTLVTVDGVANRRSDP